jgi:hypothetical protein
LLDGLKLDLGLLNMPHDDDLKQKGDTYRASVVFDENEEYDSEEEEEGKTGRRSFKKARPGSNEMQNKTTPKAPKLKNLLGGAGPSER